MKYFETLFKTNPQVYEFDSPIYLFEIAIIKDTVDNEILLRNSMRNVTNEKIIAVMLNIVMKDVFGEPVYGTDGKDSFQYLYQDISFGKKEVFGNKVAIKLPSTVRKVEVTLEKAVFENGVVWKSKKQDFAKLQEQKMIHEPDNFMNTITDELGVQCLYYFMENNTCWQCTCGQPNKTDSVKCINCGLEKQTAKEYLSEKKLEEKYQKYIQEQERIKEEQEKKKTTNEEDSQKHDKNIVKESVADSTSDKKKNVTKRRPIIFGIGIAVILLCVISLFLLGRTNDKKIASILAQGLEKRLNLPKAGNNVDEFEQLVCAEEAILEFDGKKFKNEEFQSYITGVKKQKESLDYFETDQSKFWDLWYEGQNLRYNSLMDLVSSKDLEISDEAYSECGISILTNEIGHTISGSVTYQWDVNKSQYYYETSFRNVTDLTYENVIVNLTFGNEINTCTTSEWKSGDDWKVKMYMDQDTINSESVDLGIEFVKYQYKDVLVDNSDAVKTESGEDHSQKSDYSNIPESIMDETMKEYLGYYDKGYNDLGLNRNKASNTMGTRYPQDKKAKFLGEECQIFIWFSEKTMDKNGKPTDIQIGYPFTGYSIEELKDKFKKELNSDFMEESDTSFKIAIPDTDLYISCHKITEVSSADIFLKKTVDNDQDQKSSQMNTTQTNSTSEHICDVDSCNKEGTNKYLGLSGQYEYYCDEHYKEMMDIIDSMESDVGKGSASRHLCEVDGCNKEGTYSIEGISGSMEYYCTEHYNEMEKMLENMLN